MEALAFAGRTGSRQPAGAASPGLTEIDYRTVELARYNVDKSAKELCAARAGLSGVASAQVSAYLPFGQPQPEGDRQAVSQAGGA